MIDPAVEHVLLNWVRDELSFWVEAYSGKRDFEDAFNTLSVHSETIFALDIMNGKVAARPKPGVVDEAGEILGDNQRAIRLRLYMNFIGEAVREYAPDLSTTIALDVHDISSGSCEVPVIAFQKMVEARTILLPDIDFMNHHWYEDRSPEPSLEGKSPIAMFVGASTGAGILNLEDVRRDHGERLSLARDLLAHPSIRFHIGTAAQCHDRFAEEALKTKPYYSGAVSWEDQLQARYLISVDGNGATCSRVVNSLRSNSVLVKRSSRNLLYYFRGLVPWRHYIPFETVEDLDEILRSDRKGVFDIANIVHEANAFFESFLRTEPVHRYLALLLTCYEAHVRGGQPWPAPRKDYFPGGDGVPHFDPARYLELNPDVAAARHDPFHHYLEHGVLEGRRWF